MSSKATVEPLDQITDVSGVAELHAPPEVADEKQQQRDAHYRLRESSVDALVEIDGNFLPYWADTFRRLGGGLAGGLRTNVTIEHGIGCPQRIQIAYEVKIGDKYCHMATTRTDLNQVVEFKETTISPLHPERLKALRQLLPDDAPASDLRYNAFSGKLLPPSLDPKSNDDLRPKSRKIFHKDPYQLSLPEAAMLHDKHVKFLTMSVPSTSFVWIPSKMFNQSQSQNNSLSEATTKMIKDVYTKASFKLRVVSMLSGSEIGDPDNTISHCNPVAEPFAEFFSKAYQGRKGKPSDLKLSSLVVNASRRPLDNGPPPPPDTDFVSDEHRTAVLITSAAEEACYEEWRSDRCDGHPFKCMIPLAGSEWKAKPNVSYGIQPNGLPKACILVVGVDEYKGSLPNIGSKVEVQLSTNTRLHAYPQVELTHEQVNKAANDIVDILERAHGDALNERNRHCLWALKHGNFGEEPHEGASSAYHDALKEALGWRLSSFLDPPLVDPSDMTWKHFKHRQHERSVDIGRELIRGKNEDPAAHHQRVVDWVHENGMALRNVQGGGPETGTIWSGYRLKLPDGVASDKAIFEIEIPLQPMWPAPFTAPPIMVDLPQRPMGPLHTGQEILEGIESKEPPLRCSIRWQFTSLFADLECDAISRFNASNEDGRTNPD